MGHGAVRPSIVVNHRAAQLDGRPATEDTLHADMARTRRCATAVWRAEGRRSAARQLDGVIARASAPDTLPLTNDALRDLISCRWLRAGLAAIDLRFDLAARHVAAGWMGCVEMHGRLGGDDCSF